MMPEFGIELELSALLALLLFGSEIFAPFEIETAAWRKIVKWSVMIGLTLTLYAFVGHWALAAPAILGTLGLTVHFGWCRKNQIHPFRATPRRRY
ncbi:MAG: hypothetical protein ACI84D_003832, partial [Thalassolituus oleivorans]